MDSQKPATRCFTASDAIPAALEGERIAVLGYGHLGQPFALNLRELGNHSIGNREYPRRICSASNTRWFCRASHPGGGRQLRCGTGLIAG